MNSGSANFWKYGLFFLFIFQTLGYKEYSGYILINSQYNAKLFYWLFESQNKPNTDPLVLWMTGSGYSSEISILFDSGPITVNSMGTSTVPNQFGWNQFANILFVDQPAPTGYSTCSQEYINNEKQVVEEMLTFLSGFMELFPKYSGCPFYIIGESFGGQYVPSIAAGVMGATGKIKGQEYLVKYDLKAIGIGNGWVDPYIQFGSYGLYAYQNKLITEEVWSQMNETYEQCKQDLNSKAWSNANKDCNALIETVLESAGNINWYNIKLPCNDYVLCYDIYNIITYLNNRQVQQQLGVSDLINWQPWNFFIKDAFDEDILQSYMTDIPTLLTAGIRVVVYNGDLDLICNWIGGLQWTMSMEWSGKSEFNKAPVNPWSINGTVVGTSISYKNFAFVRIFNAGNMVPHDKPALSLQLLDNIITGRSFS